MSLTRVLLLAAVACLGCSGRGVADLTPPVRRGVLPLGPELNPPPTPPPEPLAPKVEWREELRTPDAGKKVAAKAEPERDYSAELLSALGDTSGCIKPRLAGASAASEVLVQLEAYVMEAGNIGRSYVNSGQLDGEESECIHRRLAAVRMQTPIEQAPRAVHASLRLALKTAANTAN